MSSSIKRYLQRTGWTLIAVLIFMCMPNWTSAQTGNGDMPPNPFIKHMFTADPSAHVWSDGRLYVYPSRDIAPPRGADLMDQYHVFSTDDMITWIDHGEILRASDVEWGRPEGGFMWAPDCAFKNGTYYFYFPHPSGTEWNTTWKIGVATSNNPASDFVVQGYIPGLDSHIDPCVFIDDDGHAYFYYGGGGVSKGGKLKSNMMEIDGAMQNMQGLVDFHEASWVHKKDGLYYLSYSDNHDDGNKHNRMRYATSTNPLGPWTSRGIYMDPTDSYTNHGSIVEFEGQWYSFYHNSALSGNDWLRSICVDKLFYNADGTIQLVVQTKGHGTPYQGTAWSVPGKIEAEDYDVGGPAISYSDSDTVNHGNQYRPDEFVDVENCGEGGYNVGFMSGGEWLEYTINVAKSDTYILEIRVASANQTGSSIRAEFNGEDITGTMVIPNTGGWQNYTTITKEIQLTEGEQIMRLLMGDGAFNFNYVEIQEIPDVVTTTESEFKSLRIYPNPNSRNVTIELNENSEGVTKVMLIDPSGKIVSEQNVIESRIELTTNGFMPGVYMLRLHGKRGTVTRKIVIE